MTAKPLAKPPEETGGTDFAIKHGKIRVRWDWAGRAVVLVLLCGANVQAYLTRQFISRTEYSQRDSAISGLSIKIEELDLRLRAVESQMEKPERKR